MANVNTVYSERFSSTDVFRVEEAILLKRYWKSVIIPWSVVEKCL